MRLGFDFDKVLINYPPLLPSGLFDKYYKKRDNGILLYRIPTFPEQLLRKLLHLPFMRPAIKHNMDFLKSISKKNNKLFLISSRFKFLEPETKRLLKKHQLDKVFDQTFFNFENKQPHEFKNEVLKKLNLDIYTDDDLSLLKHVAKNNSKTKFFWLNYKKEKKQLPKNIKEIYKLEEIFSK